MKNQRAMTLLEILVVCVLMGIVSFCLYNTLLPGIRAWRKSDVKADIQRNALVAAQRISRELRSSDIDSLVIIKNTCFDAEAGKSRSIDAITFLSPYGQKGGLQYDAENSAVLWKKHGVFYLDPATHTLYLQEHEITPPAISPDEYQRPAFTPDPRHDRVVARDLISLSFQADVDADKEGTVLRNPVYFEITAASKPYETSLKSGVSTSNNQK
jgi:type II secretory pathway pseudopilin PulG